jgi:hypothetical protein
MTYQNATLQFYAYAGVGQLAREKNLDRCKNGQISHATMLCMGKGRAKKHKRRPKKQRDAITHPKIHKETQKPTRSA